MAISQDALLSLLHKAFPEATLNLRDLRGDREHYALEINTPQFEGLSRVQQHQLVYQALGSKMGQDLHALTLKTAARPPEKTPCSPSNTSQEKE